MNWRVYPWLRQFAMEWQAARGQGGDFQRPFSHDWEDLLEAADILSAEGRAEAFREAQELREAKFVDLKTDRYRPYQIKRIILPFVSENRLRELFDLPSPGSGGLDLSTVDWCPKLSFLNSARTALAPEDLIKLNAYLEGNSNPRAIVPIKERSLEIFGDEKRLDALIMTSVFRGDRLSLSDLHCEQIGEPLGWRRGPEAASEQPVIIIENAATWNSYTRWNQSSARFSAVIYGKGIQCATSIQYLHDIFGELGGSRQIRYFGDIDPPGLHIPQLASDYAFTHGLPKIQPDLWSYELLLQSAGQASTWDGEPAIRHDCDWLGPLADPTWQLLAQSLRLPQEHVGWSILENISKPTRLE
jgi:hypothetical protein